jgi:hypothetical protein
MLSRIERRPSELEMGRAWRAYVDKIDVVPGDELHVRAIRVGNPEAFGEFARSFGHGIGDRDDLAARIT